MTSRRDFLKTSALIGGGTLLPGLWNGQRAWAASAVPGLLSDPALQPKFVEPVPNALDPGFLYSAFNGAMGTGVDYRIMMSNAIQQTGLVDPATGARLSTPVWGYGLDDVNTLITWPGQTVQVLSSLGSSGGTDTTTVTMRNLIGGNHLLPVDTSLHWCYSIPGYETKSFAKHGIPIIPHLHGGHSDFQFDGNPEWFFGFNNKVEGPNWTKYADVVPQTRGNGRVRKTFVYDNAVKAGNLWYHDHALGITRLNVYAGLAGFYFVRDQFDTGAPGNPLGLPAFPYEHAYAIQDRMFDTLGNLFYSAFPGDPFYDGFITGEGVVLPAAQFPGGGPTALAEFFGDHMVVNGKIWPKADVEPASHRLRLLNGTDSRFMILRFRRAATALADTLDNAGPPIPFYVIGSDQGLGAQAVMTDTLVFEPGGRYDIILNLQDYAGERIIMENLGADAPFGGWEVSPEELRADPANNPDLFADSQTDRIMAFDVGIVRTGGVDFSPAAYNAALEDTRNWSYFAGFEGVSTPIARKRAVSLFEGKDEFGRLQPLLGTVNFDPQTETYSQNAFGSEATPFTWSQPATETPTLDTTEEWLIYNFTGDAHPVHLHLVKFEVVARHALSFSDDGGVPGQPVQMHNGMTGVAPVITGISVDTSLDLSDGSTYIDKQLPKDMVTALPGQVTVIRAHFDKPGRYVWHCHILSHEDHEMMRVLEVVPQPIV